MLILIKVLVIVYYFSINLYGFFLIKFQKNNIEQIEQNETTTPEKNNKHKVTDGKLFVTGALGGALGVYIAMFIFKYRLTSLLLMVIMPVLITINLYIIIFGFYNNFWFVQREITGW